MAQVDFNSEKFGRLFVFLRRAVLLAICMALFAPVHAFAATAGSGPVPPPGVPGDENWAAEVFGLPGVDAPIYALAVDQTGELYAGGDFYSAGDAAVQGIARWDGETWHPLGHLEPDSTPGPVYVHALAADLEGTIYVGGAFEKSVGGHSLYNIARWDGVTWHPLDEGIVGSVSALAIGHDGSVYAGGEFSKAGDEQVNNIARWDGQAWHPMGSGLNQPVHALAVGSDGSIYAGGDFSTAGGLMANRIARWKGTAWRPMGAGMDGPVKALAISADGSLFAGGEFVSAGGTAANHIARWDGRSWQSLGSGVNGGVDALAADRSGAVVVGGQFTAAGGLITNSLARWDGTAWHALGSGVSGADAFVKALAVDRRRGVIAGGQFNQAGLEIALNVARWDQNGWRSLGTGNGTNALVDALVVGPEGYLFAGGEFTTAGKVAASHIARWDGLTWHPLGSGVDGSSVRALAMDGAGNIYVGGDFCTAGGLAASNIARWDGQAWYPVGPGLAGMVNALAVDEDGNLYAGGGEINRWDGSTWHHMADVVGGMVYTLALDGTGNLYAGGDFITVEGTSAKYAARYDGTAWTPLGVGTNGLDCYSIFEPCLGVRALLLDALGNVYAGGDFNRPDLHDIAYWNGATWQSVGQAQRGPYYSMGIFALARDGAGNLYAAGDDTPIGGRIARWDGVSWQALGSGLSSTAAQDTFYRYDLRTVSAMAADTRGNLYTGGRFNLAGGRLSAHVARWTAGDGACGLGIGSHTYYPESLPVAVDIVIPGTLDCIAVQRFDRSHPRATPSLATSAYWSISGTDSNGDPATGYLLDLTLPSTFVPDTSDRVCRYTGSEWVCGYSSHTATSITESGISALSEWTVQRNSGIVSRWWYPLVMRRARNH